MSNEKIKIKLNFNPHPKQKELLDIINTDGIKYVTCCAARRFGKSILARYLCLKWAMSEPNTTVLYVGPTYKLCNEFYRKFLKMVEKLPNFEGSLTQDKIIMFKNGSEIKFFSATAHDSIRGFEAQYAILDEFAYYPNLEESWDGSIRPVVKDKGKKVLFISTPCGKRGKFWDMFCLGMGSNPRYGALQASAEDSPYTDKEELADMKLTMSDKSFRQEILAQFLDLGQGGVFKNVLNCLGKGELSPKNYGGLDIGFSDSTVLTIINEQGEMVTQIEWEKVNYTELIPLINNEIKKHNVEYCYVETNGVGAPIMSFLTSQNSSVYKPWTTTNDTKNNLVEDLMIAFEQNKIVILDDQILINQLDCFEVQFTRTGKQTFNGVGAKDDRVMSLGIAWQCYKKYTGTSPKIHFRSIKNKKY